MVILKKETQGFCSTLRGQRIAVKFLPIPDTIFITGAMRQYIPYCFENDVPMSRSEAGLRTAAVLSSIHAAFLTACDNILTASQIRDDHLTIGLYEAVQMEFYSVDSFSVSMVQSANGKSHFALPGLQESAA